MITTCLMIPLNCWADAFINDINGTHYTVKRDGYPIKIEKTDILRAGDLVHVSSKSEIQLSLEGKRIVLDKSNTPFKIPATEDVSLFDNASKIAFSAFRDLMRRNTSSHVLTSRGINDHVSFVGIETDRNLIPANLTRLRLFIDRDMMSKVELYDENGQRSFDTDFYGQMVGLPIDGYAEGNYSFAIEPVFANKAAKKSGTFNVVAYEQIPVDIRVIIDQMQSPEREKVAAILLSSRDGWRLASIQYAFESGDLEVLNTILGK